MVDNKFELTYHFPAGIIFYKNFYRIILMKTFNLRMLISSAFFAALIAVGAYIRLPGPFVPFTLQMQFTNLAGLLLGKKYGAAAVGAYILAGLAGAPVFTGGGGPGYILQPTFGYIIGFLIGAYIAGVIGGRKTTFKNYTVASFAHFSAVYAIGLIYYFFISNYYLASPIGVGALFLYCFALTAPVDAALCFFCAQLSVKLIPIMRMNGLSEINS